MHFDTGESASGFSLQECKQVSGADPGFLERGFIYIRVWGLAMLILSHFS